MEDMDANTEEEELSISELLIKWNNIKVEENKVLTEKEKVKNKIKAFLKEKQWDKYLDKETKMSITITEIQKETIDKLQLKMLLNDTDYKSVVKVTTFERLNVLTKEARLNMKRFVR